MAKRNPEPAPAGRENSAKTEAAEVYELGGLVGYNLRLAYNMQVQRFSAVGGSFNIRPAQFAILMLIHRKPGIRQMEVTKALHKKHANMVTLIDELERRALVRRVPDPNDKRSRVLELTPEGTRLIRKLLERHERLERNFDETFGAAERKQLLKLLEAFRRLDPDPDIDAPGV